MNMAHFEYFEWGTNMADKNQFEDISPNFKKALVEKAHKNHPFWELLGMKLVDARKGWAVVRLPFDQKLTQADGISHGGAIFSAADAAVGIALLGMIEKGDSMVTLEMKINYFRPFTEGALLAEAAVIQKGSRTAVAEVDVATPDGKKIAKCLATFVILNR
jgi:acyl-CoA thioesterase